MALQGKEFISAEAQIYVYDNNYRKDEGRASSAMCSKVVICLKCTVGRIRREVRSLGRETTILNQNRL